MITVSILQGMLLHLSQCSPSCPMCPLITFRTCSRNHTFTHRDMLKGWHRPHFPRTQRTGFCGGCFSSFSVFGRGVFKNKCHLEVVLASCPSSCIVFSFALYSSAMQYQVAQKSAFISCVIISRSRQNVTSKLCYEQRPCQLCFIKKHVSSAK